MFFIQFLLFLKTAQSSCTGLEFNLQGCGQAGSTYKLQQGKCYQGSISVQNTHGSASYQSTMLSCVTPNGCGWNCYSDNQCKSPPAQCAPGYSSLTCNCTNVNFSWVIRIAGSQIFSWQGFTGDFGIEC